MPTESANIRFERIMNNARQLVERIRASQSDGERELLAIHALTRAHLEGMDAATEIANDAIARVVLGKHDTGTAH